MKWQPEDQIVKLDDLSGDSRIVAEAIFSAACKEGISESSAERIAVRSVLVVGSQTGGMNIYIHSTKQMFRPERDRQIMKKFTGSNQRDLAKEFGLSESHIRAIINRSSYALSLKDELE
ncbi:MAG: Mor transcription activator family protein [Deferribacterales bacterium]